MLRAILLPVLWIATSSFSQESGSIGIPEYPPISARLEFNTGHLITLGTAILGGEPKIREKYLRNNSGDAYTQIQVTFTGPEAGAFSAEPPEKIQPGTEAPIKFKFTPGKIGSHAARATVTWAGQSQPLEYELGGTGAYGTQSTLRLPGDQPWVGTALAELPNGNVLVAGYYPPQWIGILNGPLVVSIISSRLRELRPDGTETHRFDQHQIDGKVQVITVQSDGKVLIAGSFRSITHHHSGPLNYYVSIAPGKIFRLNGDGSFDTSFSAPSDYFMPLPVQGSFVTNAMAVQSDGKVIVGGEGELGGRSKLLRLNPDGSVDSTFAAPIPDGPVYALAQQGDGKLLVGGDFTSLSAFDISFRGLSRLHADGNVDTTFQNPGFTFVSALGTAADQIAIAGIRQPGYMFPPPIIIGPGYPITVTPLPIFTATSFAGSINFSGTLNPAPGVAVITTSGEIRSTRTLPLGFCHSSETNLLAIAPRALSMHPGGDVVVVHQPLGHLASPSQTPVIHLQNAFFGGATSVSRKQFFAGEVSTVLVQRDGKVLIAGSMTASQEVSMVNVGITNSIPGSIIYQPGVTRSQPLSGFAQLDINGFYPEQPVPDASGLESFSDGLSKVSLDTQPLYAGLPDMAGIPRLPHIEFTGPDADQFALEETWLAHTMNWLGYFRPYPSVAWSIRPQATRTGPLKAVAHITDPQDTSVPPKSFDIAIEATGNPGPLASLEVSDEATSTPLPSGSTSHFGSIPIGRITTRTYRIKNTGTTDLQIQTTLSGNHAADFQLPQIVPGSLAAGSAVNLTVSFSSQDTGRRDARLRFNSPGITSWSYEIRLQALAEPSADRITPLTQVVQVGGPATFSALSSPNDEEVSYQWLHQKKPILGATSSTLVLNEVQAAQAGSYQVKIITPAKTVTSSVAQLAVIGQGPSEVLFVPGKSVSLTQPATGTGLTFEWLHNGSALPNNQNIKGRTTRTLTLSNPQEADAGVYTCRVRLGETEIFGPPCQLRLMITPSLSGLPPAFAWQVGREVSEQLHHIGDAVIFTAAGLPPGLKLNPRTGQISGRPAQAGSYTLKVTAANAAGKSEPQVIPATVTGLGVYETGSFIGLLHRDPVIAHGRGGLLNLIVTATGSYSGSLGLYVSPEKRIMHRFKGQLSWNAENKAVIESALPGDGNRIALKIVLTHYIGDIFLDGQNAGECRHVVTGRRETFSLNSHFVTPSRIPYMAEAYARTIVGTSGNSMLVGKLASQVKAIPLTIASWECDDGPGTIIPVQAWLPGQETFSGWMPVPRGHAVSNTGVLGWNSWFFYANELRLTLQTAKHFPPGPGQSLLGIDDQDNLLKLTFATGETQNLLLSSKNQILPGEGGLRQWLTPEHGGYLQSASINPKTGVFTARTWSRTIFGNTIPYPGARFPHGKIEGVTLTPQEKIRGIFVSEDKLLPMIVPVEIEVVK